MHQKVRKEFFGIWYMGIVDGFRIDADKIFWHISYPDGDDEEMDLVEVLEVFILILYIYNKIYNYIYIYIYINATTDARDKIMQLLY